MGFKEDFPELLSNYFDVFSSQGVPQDTTDQQCSSCFSQTTPFHSHKHIPAKCVQAQRGWVVSLRLLSYGAAIMLLQISHWLLAVCPLPLPFLLPTSYPLGLSQPRCRGIGANKVPTPHGVGALWSSWGNGP